MESFVNRTKRLAKLRRPPPPPQSVRRRMQRMALARFAMRGEPSRKIPPVTLPKLKFLEGDA